MKYLEAKSELTQQKLAKVNIGDVVFLFIV